MHFNVKSLKYINPSFMANFNAKFHFGLHQYFVLDLKVHFYYIFKSLYTMFSVCILIWQILMQSFNLVYGNILFDLKVRFGFIFQNLNSLTHQLFQQNQTFFIILSHSYHKDCKTYQPLCETLCGFLANLNAKLHLYSSILYCICKLLCFTY